MLWALVLMQEVLCAQEEKAPPNKKRHTHVPVSEESAWEPPSPNFWKKLWKTRWKDPKGQTWELLSLQQDCFNRVHEVWVKLPPEWPEDAS